MSCPVSPISEDIKVQLLIRRFAGTFILGSLVLSRVHSPYWLWFTAFVGANLLQSSFTRLCPLETLLKMIRKGKNQDAVHQLQA